jgi:D-alanyl-D-alanine carboxypeptidase
MQINHEKHERLMTSKTHLSFSIIIFWLLCSLCSSAQTQNQVGLMNEILRLERECQGHLGVMAKDLKTGEVVKYNAAERFPTASVIKLPVMATVFHLVDRKQLDLNAGIVLSKEDKKPGSGILQFLSDGASISLLDAVKLMIILSDNTATNLVLDYLAPNHQLRMNAVNALMEGKRACPLCPGNRCGGPKAVELHSYHGRSRSGHSGVFWSLAGTAR